MNPYTRNINRVVDHIQNNLDTGLSINQLAKVACFSEFHFNRIFKATMGESVYQFIRRLRLERSATLLLGNPRKSVTEIALTCGFSTPSSFAKSFKNHFKMSATAWRNKSNTFYDMKSSQIQIERGRITIVNGTPQWTFNKEDSIRQVIIEDIPPQRVAYIRNIGSYIGDATIFNKLYDQLFRWGAGHGQLCDDTFTMNIYHDNPHITKRHKLRLMAAIPVSDTAHPFEEIGITEISGGKYGVCRFLLKSEEFSDAWNWMFSAWLANSGYEWDTRESFERCLGEQTVDGVCRFKVDICVPIKAKL